MGLLFKEHRRQTLGAGGLLLTRAVGTAYQELTFAGDSAAASRHTLARGVGVSVGPRRLLGHTERMLRRLLHPAA